MSAIILHLRCVNIIISIPLPLPPPLLLLSVTAGRDRDTRRPRCAAADTATSGRDIRPRQAAEPDRGAMRCEQPHIASAVSYIMRLPFCDHC